jgi:hypothetical protein
MANGWSAKNVALAGAAVSGTQTAVVTNEFPNSAGGALNGVIKLKVSGLTGTVSAKLQTANGSDWIDVKTVSVSATDTYIRWNIEVSADQALLPLLNKSRIQLIAATGTAIVESCEVLQEL